MFPGITARSKTVTKKTKTYKSIEDLLRVHNLVGAVLVRNAQLKILKTSYRMQEKQYLKFVLEKAI